MASVAAKALRQPRFEEFLRANGASIARLIDPAANGSELAVKLLKCSEASTVFKLTYQGKTKLLKRYEDGFSDRFRKEVTTLRFLRQSGLAPKIEHACTQERYLITEFIDGNPVSENLTQENLDIFCYLLGSWLGDYTKAVPHIPVETNWLEYVRKIEGLRDAPAFNVYDGLLARTKITKQVLSRGDQTLGNFLQTGSGSIVGIDYEHAIMKPLGWDLLQLATTLTRRFPQDIDTIASGLADGFTLQTPGSRSRYQSLIKVFVAATAFGPLTEACEEDASSIQISESVRKTQFAKILRNLRGGK